MRETSSSFNNIKLSIDFITNYNVRGVQSPAGHKVHWSAAIIETVRAWAIILSDCRKCFMMPLQTVQLLLC